MSGVTWPYSTGNILTNAQWTALFAQCYPNGNVSTYSATLLAGTSQAAWFTALGLPSAAVGAANGLAQYNSSAQIPIGNLPSSITTALNQQGTWNASTNSPALVSGVGTKGYFYQVSTAGTTTLDSFSSWSVNDIAFFDGTHWQKIQSSGNITIPSTSITDSTTVGRALLTSASVLAQRASLQIDQATLVNDTNQTATNAMEAIVWTAITAARTGTLPAASGMNAGQAQFWYDESGSCSSTNTITISRAGSDTINGGSTYVLNAAYAGVMFIRASSTKWTALPFTLPTVSNTWVTSAPNVRQAVSTGPVDGTYGLPTLLPATAASLSITSQNVSSSAPFVATAANGSVNSVGQQNLTGATTSNITWSGLTASTTNYLYVSINTSGVLTPLVTTLQPIYQFGGTPAVTSGQFTFNISTMTGYMGNGSTAAQAYIVFIGEAVTGSSTVTSAIAYAYNGLYDSGWTATLPSGSTQISKNSNMGLWPQNVRLLAQCTTNDATTGYVVGDQVELTLSWNSTNNVTAPITLVRARNTVGFSLDNGGVFVELKTGGNSNFPTLADWKYKIIAGRGW